ncbi:MAG: tRNA (N6-isopentenyl adenosine(37)-C2)-methylthiotransferase MiaB [Candidatus Omnitrophica bacterium]|nr:tRNA (N6-isopentenyl adenosine(37)-C2)-methylthiotransferase MiaB [Candidatus Omnitrophota bacterium]
MAENERTDDKSGDSGGKPQKKLRVLLRTFGCQMNQADSEVAMGIIGESHLDAEFVEDRDTADVILINTCSVRDHAEQRVFGLLRELKARKQKRPKRIIGVMGCMAVEYKEKLFREFPHIDFICGAKDIDKLPELIDDASRNIQKAVITEEGYGVHEGKLALRKDGVCALVPITHGCDNYCSYCIVPYVRGREISRPTEEILDELNYLAEKGYKQIVFLGQNVNSYGAGLKTKITFTGLLKKAAEINGIELIEFMTSHPKDASDELIEAMASDPKISKHIHLPVQSGSNVILRKMKRNYTREAYLQIVKTLQKSVLDVSITTDIIVGFPGETDSDFNDTIELMKAVPFDASFIFKYSPRAGTEAHKLPDNVPQAEKERRNQALLEIQNELSAAQNSRYIGRAMKALIVQKSRKNADEFLAVTWNDKLVVVPGKGLALGNVIDVTLDELSNNTFKGTVTAIGSKK